MAIFFDKSKFPTPIIPYNFKAACGVNPLETHPLLAGGFFVSPLSDEVLTNPACECSPEDVVALRPFVGQNVLWMEESSSSLYPPDELKAILLHEQAHLLFDHLSKKQGIEPVLEQELEADTYAADHVGKDTIRKAIIRTAFIVAQRRHGGGEKATNMAKRILRCEDMAPRIAALK
jgi:hypothetical protein